MHSEKPRDSIEWSIELFREWSDLFSEWTQNGPLRMEQARIDRLKELDNFMLGMDHAHLILSSYDLLERKLKRAMEALKSLVDTVAKSRTHNFEIEQATASAHVAIKEIEEMK